MFVKITVESGQKTASSYVPTRDKDGTPLDQALVARLASSTVETLAWRALGYPERDMLEMGDPWATDRAGESEPDQEDRWAWSVAQIGDPDSPAPEVPDDPDPDHDDAIPF